MWRSAPLGLGGFEGLALRVVADDLDVGEAPKVELLGPEHGHFCGCFLNGKRQAVLGRMVELSRWSRRRLRLRVSETSRRRCADVHILPGGVPKIEHKEVRAPPWQLAGVHRPPAVLDGHRLCACAFQKEPSSRTVPFGITPPPNLPPYLPQAV